MLTVLEDSSLELVDRELYLRSVTLASVGSLAAAVADPSRPERMFAFPICTALQIHRKYILTAAHCMQQPVVFVRDRVADRADPDYLRWIAVGGAVRLQYAGPPLAADSKEFSPADVATVVFAAADLDVAILELPRHDESSAYVALFGTEPPQGSRPLGLVVYGYPHGAPLTAATGCTLLASAGDEGGSRDRIYHNCDTTSGSSGALMVHDETGTPVGIHLAGQGRNEAAYWQRHERFESLEVVAQRNGCPDRLRNAPPQGGETDQSLPCLISRGANRGVPLAAIRAALRKNAPELFSALQADSVP